VWQPQEANSRERIISELDAQNSTSDVGSQQFTAAMAYTPVVLPSF